MTDLTHTLGADGLEKMTRTWLAFSATNIVFNSEGNLILGLRKAPAEAIPEPGDYVLIGGFNTDVPGPAMFSDVADWHARAQLGLTLTPEQCSDFLMCEYDMKSITAPLNPPYGKMPIKRVAFDRFVVLTKKQEAAMVPGGKIKATRVITEEEFTEMVTNSPESLSFVHEIDHVYQAFTAVREVIGMDMIDPCEWQADWC